MATIGSVTDAGVLVLEDVTCEGNFDAGLSILDDAAVTLERCTLTAVQSPAVALATTIDGDLVEHVPTLTATNVDAVSPSPAWSLAARARLSDCSGQGLALGGLQSHVAGFRAYGTCADQMVAVTGTQQFLTNLVVQGSSTNGIVITDASCTRVTSSQVYMTGAGDVNLSGFAVEVTGANEQPEVMVDRIDICGPGTATVVTYGCNSGEFDCSGDPCADCAPGPECYDPDYASPSPCTDPLCWPPEEDQQPELFSFCTSNSGLWNAECPIKTTRHVELTWRDLTAGAVSNLWRPNTIDLLAEAELHVWTDDYGGAAGDTEVIIYDDTSGLSWTLTCPSTDAAVKATINHDLVPGNGAGGPLGPASQLRAEIVSVTVPVTQVEVSVTLRLP